MPDPNETPVPDPDELARRFEEMGGEHYRADIPEAAGQSPIDPESGPGHYAAAGYYARQAAEALYHEDVARAQALAAIGQIHAMLAAAAAAAVQDRMAELDWHRVTKST
jgi:hypothetical protein